MKDQSGVAIQFSGYPLRVVDLPRKNTKVRLTVIRPELMPQTTSIQKNKITNDPGCWDEGCFGSYE
jgi:hypothetical protein